MTLLRHKRGLIVGIANDRSIAFGCARACRAQGAELALTYLNGKAQAYVQPLAERLEASLILPLDVEAPGELETVFAAIRQHWGRLDFLIHAIAFAPTADLHGRVVDCSREGFARAMDVSCHSFLRMARLAEPLMRDGGALLTMTYHGADQVVDRYGIMGPVKAALQSSVRYLATELGPQGIRVHAISPGPIATRAASGIRDFARMHEEAQARSPMPRLASIDDVGALCAYLVSDAACAMSGETIYVDAGLHIRH